jgi:hypothetical protein
MMQRLTLIICHVLLVNLANAQMYAMGGNGIERSNGMIVCANSDLVVIGSTNSDNDNNANVYIMRLDTSMQCIWSLSLGGAGIESGVSIAENADGNLLAVGQTSNTNNNGYGIATWLMDADGEILWQQILGGADWDFAKRVVHDGNNGFWIVGSTFSFGNGGTDALLIHIGANGALIDQWTYGGVNDDEFVDIDLLNNGLWLVSGNKKQTDTTSVGWLATIDESGLLEDLNYFGNDTLSTLIHHTIIHDNYIAHCGHVFDNGITNSYIRRLSQDGVVDWERIEAYQNTNTALQITYHDESYFTAIRSSVFGVGGNSAILYRFSWDGWFLDGLVYGDQWDDQFVSAVWNFDQHLYALGDYTYADGSSNLILYKLGDLPLSSENIGDQIPLDCFSVSIQDLPKTKQPTRTLYYNGYGQQIAKDKLPNFYIEKRIFGDGSIEFQKFLILTGF